MVVGGFALVRYVVFGEAPDRHAQAAQVGKNRQTAAVDRFEGDQIDVGDPYEVPFARTKTGVLEIGVTRSVGRDQYVVRASISVNGNEFERQGVDRPEDAIIGHQQKFSIRMSERRQRRSIRQKRAALLD